MEEMGLPRARKNPGLVPDGERGNGSVKKLQSGTVSHHLQRTFAESTYRQRMRRDILYVFSPKKTVLYNDMIFLCLELANLVRVGHRLLSFSVFFPRLIKSRKHEPVDATRHENLPEE